MSTKIVPKTVFFGGVKAFATEEKDHFYYYRNKCNNLPGASFTYMGQKGAYNFFPFAGFLRIRKINDIYLYMGFSYAWICPVPST